MGPTVYSTNCWRRPPSSSIIEVDSLSKADGRGSGREDVIAFAIGAGSPSFDEKGEESGNEDIFGGVLRAAGFSSSGSSNFGTERGWVNVGKGFVAVCCKNVRCSRSSLCIDTLAATGKFDCSDAGLFVVGVIGDALNESAERLSAVFVGVALKENRSDSGACGAERTGGNIVDGV